MAMGIFDQLAWLTNKVKKLCCTIKVGGLQHRSVDAALYESPNSYTITEGGIYNFYGGTGVNSNLDFTCPTSYGQTMYIVNVSTTNQLTTGGAICKPLDGTTTTSSPIIGVGETWLFISIDGTQFDPLTPIVWRGFKLYPNVA